MTAIVRSAPDAQVWEAADWKKLWRSICAKTTSWRSLAIVPAGPGVSQELSLEFALALAHAGSLHLGEHIDVANATRVQPGELPTFLEELARYVRERDRLVVALSPFSQSAASLALARAADSALLCVLLGQVAGPAARQTVAQLGASHFVGSAAVRLPASRRAAGAGRADGHGAAPPAKPRT